MGLPQGKTNNRSGRPKGSKTKITLPLRSRINDFVSENFSVFQKDLEQLTPKDRINTYIKLLSFALPTLQSIDSKAEINDKLQSLSVNQLEVLIDQILTENG